MSKKIRLALVLLLAAGILTASYFLFLTDVKTVRSINAIPGSAAMIIQVDAPFDDWNKVKENKIWEQLGDHPYMADISHYMDSLDTVLRDNDMVWKMAGSRPLTVSIHRHRADDYEMLYVIDLGRASRLTRFKNYLEDLVGDYYKVTNREYHGMEILELKDLESQENLFLTFHNNLLILSYTHVLVEASIDQLEEPEVARDLHFVEVSEKVNNRKTRIFIQHKMFADFLHMFTSEDYYADSPSMQSMAFSGINLDIGKKELSLHGVMNFDQAQGLLGVLTKSGKGRMELPEIVPDNASMYMSLGFNDMKTFYQHLEASLGSDSEAYLENKEKLEKFLDISIEEHFLSWVDDEIGFVHWHPEGYNKENEFAAVFKASDVSKAAESLNFVSKQIRKKTPVKFKAITYKEHQINFLSVKGFFKAILGKMFSKLEKPYYTIVGDYVIFSNDPKTLGLMIDSYLDEHTLSKNNAFQDFVKQYKNKSSMFLYFNSRQFVEDVKEMVALEYKDAMEVHQPYIEKFPMMGFQMVSKDKLLHSSFYLEYMKEESSTSWYEGLIDMSGVPDSLKVENMQVEEQVITPEHILPDDLTGKKQVEHYDNGQVRFEVPLKDGQKNGTYLEYDKEGNLVVKGRYRDNKRSGVWKTFDQQGNVIDRKRY